MSDEPNADDTLSWLCWNWAMDGQRFYPVKETSKECVDNLYDEDHGVIERAMAREWEEGQHSRAFDNAQMKFRQMKQRGFDPVERAAREHRRVMNMSNAPVDPIDWSWYYGE